MVDRKRVGNTVRITGPISKRLAERLRREAALAGKREDVSQLASRLVEEAIKRRANGTHRC